LQPAVVEVSSEEEPPCQKGSSSGAPEDVNVPLRALITLRDPGATTLEDPSASAVVPAASPCPQAPIVSSSPAGPRLEGPSTASATADSPTREVRPAKPIAIPSAIPLAEPTVAPSAVASSSEGAVQAASAATVRTSERVHPREPIVPSLAIATSFSGQVCLSLSLCNCFGLLLQYLAYPLFFRTWTFQNSSRLIPPRLDRPYWKPLTLPRA
jgi:hypothetical protein